MKPPTQQPSKQPNKISKLTCQRRPEVYRPLVALDGLLQLLVALQKDAAGTKQIFQAIGS